MGVFQQRPSQGWGSTAELEDPVYATTKFFAALVKVPGYAKMPVQQAAQDVQHSADGYAYEQWAGTAQLLANYFTGADAAGVSCWYSPSGKADLTGALKQLTSTFGARGQERGTGGGKHGPFGEKNERERRGGAGAAGRGLGGGQLAGGLRSAVQHQPGTVCRLCVERHERRRGLAAGRGQSLASGSIVAG